MEKNLIVKGRDTQYSREWQTLPHAYWDFSSKSIQEAKEIIGLSNIFYIGTLFLSYMY